MKTKTLFLIISLLSLALTSGCAKPAGLSDDQLTAVADHTLKSLEANDFQQFRQDMSDQMRAAFTADQFTSLRDMVQKASGHYQSVGKPSLTDNQEYAVYRFPAKYDQETVYMTLMFLIGGDKVEGFWLDSPNLRKAPK